jgi:cytoskeleton protein RodZ
MNPTQSPLFKEPLGVIFKSAREKLGISIEDAAKNMKFSAYLIQAIEEEQWEKLGAALYAKSYITSYIKLLGLDEALRHEVPNLTVNGPVLKTITQTRVASVGIQSKSIFAMVTLLGLTALLAFFYFNSTATSTTAENNIPLSIPLAVTSTITTAPTIPAPVVATQQDAQQVLPAPKAVVLTVRTSQLTWMEIRDTNNAVVFSELIPAQQVRTQSLLKIGKITLGNASSAQLLLNDQLQNLSAFIKDDVARFSIDANGNAIALLP